jgi:hypothetical protein
MRLTNPSTLLPRSGFTLFEVSISLVLVAFGVISVLMMLPSGMRAQQMSRYQILASVRAMEMVDVFSSATDASIMLDREGPHPWDTATSYRAYAPDLETRIGSFRYGLYPLPADIAHRLDSDGDEIQQILADGGYIYYSQPSATSAFNPVGARENMPAPNESQKILCAVTGYAQQNAIPSLSYKDWPYHAPYPSPPMHLLNYDTGTSKPNAPWSVFYTDRGEEKVMLWEDTLEADSGDMALVFQAIVKGSGSDLKWTTQWVNAGATGGLLAGKYNHMGKPFYRNSGYFAYGDCGGWIPDFTPGTPAGTEWRQNNSDGSKRHNSSPNAIQPATIPYFSNMPPYTYIGQVTNPVATATQKELAKESAIAYFALAKWYANRKGVSSKIADGVLIPDDANLLTPTNLFQSGSGTPALAVNAARLLAHAAMCLTQHDLAAGSVTAGQLSVIREGTNAYAGQSPAFSLTMTMAKNYVENAMRLGMRFASSYPYDWGSPRPLNRATMMDFPLLQYDPFDAGRITPITTYFSGYNYGSRPATSTLPAKSPEQWKILSAQPITNIGRSFCYPSMNLAALWPSVTGTTSSHFTLARRFEPADRTRQLVFWAVDWQAYIDFETAPSAPVDASRYPKGSPHGASLNGNAAKPDILMQNAHFHDRHQFSARNPEKTLAFVVPTAGQQTGAELVIGGNDSIWADDSRPDLGIDNVKHPNAPLVFSGQYGADRNFNSTKFDRDANNVITKMYGKLDRGPVPKSVRMRATLIGRFNFYDPRLPMVIR